ncbi:MAG TPA: VOC family protein [Noviherbaspirillum sp.]
MNNDIFICNHPRAGGTQMKKYLGSNTRIDHIAIAVRDIDEALFLYRDVFGFELLQRREISGRYSGMVSAELNAGGFSIVLVQGTDPESQVNRYIQEFGPGVQHVAIEVDDVESVAKTLTTSGVQFATDVIRGDGLIQIFTKREDNSGMMFEFIQRARGTEGFEAPNIQQLFQQLEANNAC